MKGSERRTPPPLLCVTAGVLLVVAELASTVRGSTFVDELLRRKMRFSAADLRSLDAGAAVVKSLETPARGELSYFGVVHIQVPPERLIDRFRDIEQFEDGPGILQIRRFSVVPQLQDLASLTLPVEDVRALRTCRPGDCEVKLSAAAMNRFRNEVNWSSSNAARDANEVAREMILELVRRYQLNGIDTLGRFDDVVGPRPIAEEFRALLPNDDLLPAPVPALTAYLENYPHDRPAEAEDFFYWSLVDFGLKPTIRANHVTIYPLPASSSTNAAYVIAIQQLYASHYLHSALELRFLVNDRQPGRPGFYLVSITRSRVDGMTGFTGALLRPIVNRRARSAIGRYLEHVKQQVERLPAAPSELTHRSSPGVARAVKRWQPFSGMVSFHLLLEGLSQSGALEFSETAPERHYGSGAPICCAAA